LWAMTDDLLRALGRHQRHDLEGGLEGDLEGDAEAAASAESDDDPWAAALLPLEADEQEQLLDRMFAQVDAAERAEPPVERAEQDEGAEPAKVIPIDRPGRRLWGGTLAVATAAAAALLLWWGSDREPDQTLAMLPDYATSELRGGEAAVRGEPSEDRTLALRPNGNIDWVLTPTKPVVGGVEVALLAEAVPAGPDPVFVARVPAQVSGPGALRLRGPLDDFVALTPGEWRLTLVIAAPGQLPTSVTEITQADRGDWRRVSIRVKILADE
ncbi:MAG: hypothetical protein KC431_16995, partial [Myxococcales bacterium]|nr:hypothetical protein [Myxococcales bacterium]